MRVKLADDKRADSEAVSRIVSIKRSNLARVGAVVPERVSTKNTR